MSNDRACDDHTLCVCVTPRLLFSVAASNTNSTWQPATGTPRGDWQQEIHVATSNRDSAWQPATGAPGAATPNIAEYSGKLRSVVSSNFAPRRETSTILSLGLHLEDLIRYCNLLESTRDSPRRPLDVPKRTRTRRKENLTGTPPNGIGREETGSNAMSLESIIMPVVYPVAYGAKTAKRLDEDTVQEDRINST